MKKSIKKIITLLSVMSLLFVLVTTNTSCILSTIIALSASDTEENEETGNWTEFTIEGNYGTVKAYGFLTESAFISDVPKLMKAKADLTLTDTGVASWNKDLKDEAASSYKSVPSTNMMSAMIANDYTYVVTNLGSASCMLCYWTKASQEAKSFSAVNEYYIR